jgi:tetratricopeptide (TPR) repeat protein
VTRENARELLRQLCGDLQMLHEQAGGPSLRRLADRVPLGKSQLGAILNGRVQEPPDWQVIRAVVETIIGYAREHGRSHLLSLPTGVEDFWRHQHAIVEHAFVRSVARQGGENPDRPLTAGSPAPPPVPRQLPFAGRFFVGRTAELSELNKVLAAGGGPAATPVVVIDGPAGVGKTTLAVRWAQQIAADSFDLQLYVNLRGFDPEGKVMSCAEAVRGFLDALGLPAGGVPVGLDAQTAVYRSLLAGRRTLLLLDNAHDAAQVRALLPGTTDALTVVTSRNQLGSLIAVEGAYRIRLDLLSPTEARDLLVERLGAERVSAEPESTEQIIRACARLPLALAVVAARAQHTGFPLAVLADQLREVRDRLDVLDAGDAQGQVRSAFSWSYRTLTPLAAQLLRLLGLYVGDDLSATAAASLAGRPQPETSLALAELIRANLLVEHVPGRYTGHDLLRSYAAELTLREETEPQRRAAIARLRDHYLHTGLAADRLLHPNRDLMDGPPAAPRPGVTLACLSDRAAAMAWLTVERPCLLAMQRQAAATTDEPWEDRRYVWQLAWVLETFLRWQGYRLDRMVVWQAALRSVTCLGDPLLKAHAHRFLAAALQEMGALADAEGHLREAIALYERIGDVLGQAHSRYTVAGIRQRQGERREALALAQHALTLYQAAGSLRGEAMARNAVGWHSAMLGDYTYTLMQCSQALALLRDIDDGSGQASAWDSLGYAYHHLADHARAAACYGSAIALYRRAGDRYYESDALTHLGDSHHASGNRAAALASWQEALDILTQLDHPDAEKIRARMR